MTGHRRFHEKPINNAVQEEILLGLLDFLKMAPICCPETSVDHCHYRLRNISEEQRCSEALPVASLFRDLLYWFRANLKVVMNVIMY